MIVCYNYKRKSALAVYTEVTAKTVDLLNIDPRPPFYTDKRLDKKVATTTKDYTGTGYDRGHLGASDASHDWSKETLKATYSMANIVPQTKRANRYKFVSLEKLEREMAVKHGVLEILTLVYFNDRPKLIGKSGLQVPSAFALTKNPESSTATGRKIIRVRSSTPASARFLATNRPMA